MRKKPSPRQPSGALRGLAFALLLGVAAVAVRGEHHPAGATREISAVAQALLQSGKLSVAAGIALSAKVLPAALLERLPIAHGVLGLGWPRLAEQIFATENFREPRLARGVRVLRRIPRMGTDEPPWRARV